MGAEAIQPQTHSPNVNSIAEELWTMAARSAISSVARGFGLLAVAICVLCGWMLVQTSASRASVCGAEAEYVGPEDGAWLSPSNWSPAGLPTAGQTVCIPAGKGVVEVSGGTAQAGTLQAESSVRVDGGATLHLASGGGAISLFAANLTIDSAGKVVDDKGKIRVEGSIVVDGEVEGSGAFGENELSLDSFTASLSGTGRIAFPFASATGEVAPGGNGEIGTLTFTKSFDVNGDVKLSFDVAGTSSYDRIVSSQEVAMPTGVEMSVNVLPSYSPAPGPGQEWQVIQSPVPAVFPGHPIVAEPWELREGPGGDGANLRLTQALPSAPQPPKLKATAGDTTATFEVTPTDNGNGQSPEYFVRVEPGNIEQPAGFPLAGLTNCTAYSATAIVRTTAGTSAPSEPVTFMPSGPAGCGAQHSEAPEGAGSSRQTGTGETETAPATPATGAERAAEALDLGCTGRSLVLNDVYMSRGHVFIAGDAARTLAGSKVRILFDQRVQVATATVGRDGRFTASAPLPPARIREATSTRYSAAIGTLRSLSLKLTRRLLLEPPVASGGTVTLRGRIAPPLTKPLAPIVVEQELDCGRSTVVTSFLPAVDGRFSVTLPAPGAGAAIYRLTSRVAASVHAAGRGFTTWSLPLSVRLG
jgi:hypothetical protein